MRGPIDVLKETWEADKKSSVVSYVLSVREKLDKMAEVNIKEAQQTQNVCDMSKTLAQGSFKQVTSCHSQV